MSIAERIYRTNKNKTESAEDRAYRLAREHNAILRRIEQVNDARTFLQCRNAINAYANEAGKNSLEVMRLVDKLNKCIRLIMNDTQQNIDKLNAEIEAVKNDKFIESAEVLQELNTQVEHRLLQFMMKLGTNNDGNTGNRRKIGNFVFQADRADAIALMKLASLPQYADCFTTKQKSMILEKSNNPAEVVFEKNKELLLAEKSSQLGKEYMKAMNIRNTLKKIGNTEGYYFKEGEV